LAELAGVLPGNLRDLDGVSQVQGLQDNLTARHELFVGYVDVHSQHYQWFGPSLRHLNWKIVQGGYYAGPDENNPTPKGTQYPIPGGLVNSAYLLFDLESDPLEEVNLVDQYPDVLKDMMYKLQLYQQSYVPPQVNDNSNCPFTGLVNTSMGPTWYES
jgi:hypothetical protein